jgi:F-type H+-transporting ATPase subunit k
MATLGATFAGAWLAMPSSNKSQPPPIKASSKDEELFIQYVECSRHLLRYVMAS